MNNLGGWVLLISLGFLLSAAYCAEEKKTRMGILLVPVGNIDERILEMLKNDLQQAFGRQVSIGKEMREPDDAFDRKRNQYRSTTILKAIANEKECSAYERALGVVDHDLFVPELNFVFGEAWGKIAVVSLTRLRQSFYRQPENGDVFRKRAVTEAVHELGHTFGLGHCANPSCVMFFSNSLADTDRKGPDFCPGCKTLLPSPTVPRSK